MKSNKGITLIALIITIIIMLILVGVVTNIVIKTKLFEVAKDATTRWNSAQMNESKSIDEVDKLIDEIVYNKVEPTEMYAALYSDGTLVFYKNSENILNERNGATLVKQTENISDTRELSDAEQKALLFWAGDQEQAGQITSVVIAEEIAPISAKRLFMNLKNIKSITGLNKLNTCNVTSMYLMFGNCSSLEKLNISNFNTENVTSMQAMFQQCSKIESLDVSKFNTKNTTAMDYMFKNCSNLKQLDVSNWNTENVTNMKFMFANCSSLEKLDLSNWNTGKVEDMSWIFAGDDGGNPKNTMILKQIIGIEDLDVSNVKSMDRMFRHCHELTSLDLHKWNVSNV